MNYKGWNLEKKYDCAHNLVVSSLILSPTELLFLKPSLFTEQFIAKTLILDVMWAILLSVVSIFPRPLVRIIVL